MVGRRRVGPCQVGAAFLRETWRQARFCSFLHRNRHEAVEALAAGALYDPVVVKRMRMLYHLVSVESQGLMTGASWSIAAYDKMHRRAGKFDPVCWFHVRCATSQLSVDGITLLGPVPSLLLVVRPNRLVCWPKRCGWVVAANEPKRVSLSRLQFLADGWAQARDIAGFCNSAG